MAEDWTKARTVKLTTENAVRLVKLQAVKARETPGMRPPSFNTVANYVIHRGLECAFAVPVTVKKGSNG